MGDQYDPYRQGRLPPQQPQAAGGRYYPQHNGQYNGPMVVLPQQPPLMPGQYMSQHYGQPYAQPPPQPVQQHYMPQAQPSQYYDMPVKQVYMHAQQQMYPSVQQYQSMPPQQVAAPPYHPQHHNQLPIPQAIPIPQRRRSTPSQVRAHPKPHPLPQKDDVDRRSEPAIQPPPSLPVPIPVVEQKTKAIVTPDLPVDYRLLLLQLSDQYISEARSLAAAIALDQAGADPERYYKLIGTGMTCLETVLKQKNWTMSMPPRQEAMLQFRYASLLHEETDNDQELGELLSKSITFCERNKLLDLKYSMQHLCTRFMFKSNAKAGLNFLDNAIKDATAYQHVAWVFAFRFLRVSLHMQSANQHDLQAALAELKVIGDVARKRQEKAIIVFAAVLTALVHLRTRDPEAANYAQAALATARAQQLDESVNRVPQLTALILLIDLICSFSADPTASKEKMKTMQTYLDTTAVVDNWTRDGTLSIPILKAGSDGLVLEAGGIFTRDAAGDEYLQFTWLSKSEAYMIGMLFSSITMFWKAHEGSGKAELFIEGGLTMCQEKYQMGESSSIDSLVHATSRARHCKLMSCYMMIQRALIKCERFDWSRAMEHLGELYVLLEQPGLSPPDDLLRFALYLKGTIQQALGQFSTALSCYQNPLLALAVHSNMPSKHYTSTMHELLAILAGLNTCLIIHSPSHPLNHTLPALLEKLEVQLGEGKSNVNAAPTFATSNPALASAYNIFIAMRSTPVSFSPSPHLHHSDLQSPGTPTVTTPTTYHTGILPLKSHLQRSIALAKEAKNAQVMSVIMSLISAFFFKGQVGEAAINAAHSAKVTSKNAGMRVWQALSGGMLAERLEREGRRPEAEMAWAEVDGLAKIMPKGIWQ